jgi:hypothetical protein
VVNLKSSSDNNGVPLHSVFLLSQASQLSREGRQGALSITQIRKTEAHGHMTGKVLMKSWEEPQEARHIFVQFSGSTLLSPVRGGPDPHQGPHFSFLLQHRCSVP